MQNQSRLAVWPIGILALAVLTACAPKSSLPLPADQMQLRENTPIKVTFATDVQASVPGAAACEQMSPVEAKASLAATNAVRQQAGQSALSLSPALARAAAGHACDMANRGRMAHAGIASTGPGQRVKALGYQPSVTAENIAAGPFSLNRVLQEWAGSPHHRDNILIRKAQHFGLGRAVGADGKTVYWAAVYAAPR